MSKVGEQVLAEFYARLEKVSEVDEEMLKALKGVLGSGKKPKADDLVSVFGQEKEQELP